MIDIKDSVRQTYLYASFFRSHLTLEQLHLWLITPTSTSPKLLVPFFRNLSSKELKEINKKAEISENKINKAKNIVSVISKIPFIRAIFLTGSLAAKNATRHDDIDLMIVTSPNSLWLVRPVVILLVTLLYKRRYPNQTKSIGQISDAICLNLWLDSTALSLPKRKQNLYTAHEVLQVKPLYDSHDIYRTFLLKNDWTRRYLANAFIKLTKNKNRLKVHYGGSHQSLLIRLLNRIAFILQYQYMKKRITNESVGIHSAFFHPRDFSKKINRHLSLY